MTHELKDLIEKAYAWKKNEVKTVLATVVKLEGSSYRRPGVRMLINEKGGLHGAVSGGCVEKEVVRQAQSVFASGTPKIISYDGRFRLGCEGILYILIEPISISDTIYNSLLQNFKSRKPFQASVIYQLDNWEDPAMGTIIELQNANFSLHPSVNKETPKQLEVFTQSFLPLFQLYLFGAEHDAVQLCKMASQLGWQVHIIAPPDEQKTIDYFEGAASLSTPLFSDVDTSFIDANTAVMLMSHSFNKDLQYLFALKDTTPCYFGLLGPKHRREKLFDEFLNTYPDTPSAFFEHLHGPAGIDIGAESAPEIAVSIIAEILCVMRNVAPKSLREKVGKIHE